MTKIQNPLIFFPHSPIHGRGPRVGGNGGGMAAVAGPLPVRVFAALVAGWKNQHLKNTSFKFINLFSKKVV
jgi:hypothetical protein